MKIIQIGEAKSGNYWLYTVIQKILGFGGLPQKSFIQNHPIHPIAKSWELSYSNQADIDVIDISSLGCYFRISSIFSMPILDLNYYLDQTNHVWTHSAFNQNTWNVLSKFNKIIYLIRDPRDRAISAARFRFTPYGRTYYPHHESSPEEWLRKRFGTLIHRWVDHVGNYLLHLDTLNIHVIFYESLLYDFDRTLDTLLSYLNVDLSEEEQKAISREVQFKTMKAENPRHLNKGKSGYWKTTLTKNQKLRARIQSSPLLIYLHYPVHDFNPGNAIPYLPSKKNNTTIKNSIVWSAAIERTMRIKRFFRLGKANHGSL